MTTSALASELDSLLSGSGLTSSASASTLASELAALLSSGSIGTTTSTSSSALDSLLASGAEFDHRDDLDHGGDRPAAAAAR